MSALSYLAIFVISALLVLMATPVARRVALRFEFLDRPGPTKAHSVATPFLGGAALVTGLLGGASLYAIIRPPASTLRELVVVSGLAVLLAIMGSIDDVRALGVVSRLTVEAMAAVCLWAVDVRVFVFANGLLNFVAMVVWVVGVTNAQNFLDNVDGLSAGVAAVASGWLLLIAAVNGQFLVASLSAAVAGCALAFLFFNFHPARIFMGDGGSLFLGFLLAYLAIKLRFEGAMGATLVVPILLLGVPIFDLVLVVISRLLRGRSPLQGGSDHTSHRLLRLGLSVRVTVVSICAAGAALGGAALLVTNMSLFSGYAIAAAVAAALVVVGARLGLVDNGFGSVAPGSDGAPELQGPGKPAGG